VITAYAPGRVNLIGDHTDYSGGLVCPMAIQLGTTVELEPGGDTVELESADDPAPARVSLDIAEGAAAAVRPPWARYVAGVVAVLRPATGGRGRVSTTLPIGAGLSSSAALEVAAALALGAAPSDPLRVAQTCQRAEQLASGVPCGIMDQLISVAGVEGHALLIDCSTLDRVPIPMPAGAEVIVVHSGQSRALAGSAYADRRRQVEAAEAAAGVPLRRAGPSDLGGIADDTLRRRARHVVSENARVRAFAESLRAGDLATAGALMSESQASLRDDFEVSTPVLDALVARLRAQPGVLGARLTGAGFGGCVVALAESGTAAGLSVDGAILVRPSGGARLLAQ
jgi:galactokinase